jgi:hypothetical protein
MDGLCPGTLFFLTDAYDHYWSKRNPTKSIRFINRLAKLEEVIDWESEKGKQIKTARIKSGKWASLPLEDNRYIFSIYYPELLGRNGKPGVIERGVPLFSKDPESGKPFFVPVPDWLFKEIAKQCEKFGVEWKNEKVPEEDPKDPLEWDAATNLAFIKKTVKNVS